ncbi:MAG: AAA family ATPase [Alphaproteobacteria bacterium]|nr:AAA family ATPase [Alphaproteobacteria bacterium]
MVKNEVYIGSGNYPLPFVDEDGKVELLRSEQTYVRLPVMFEGNPEEIQARATGEMWRHLPTRGRLNSFLDDLRRRSNNIDADQEINHAFMLRRRAKLTLGNPGSGKTFKAKTLGKMACPKGAIYVNCKDRDLKTLIVKTILDTSNIDVEKNAIDARIKMYNKGDKSALSADGINLLKTMFGDAFSIDEAGKISLDWTAARGNTEYTSSDHDKEFVSLLQQFCKKEGVDYSHSVNNVGFVEKDGELVEALESGRPIILDEINRGKNQDFLLPYLDFLNGGYEDITIEAANGRVIHLNKADIPDTFMLEATGNPETAEMGIKERMSEPLKDRFDIEQVDDYHPKDFTDMFCMHATGVPIAIIKDAFHIEKDEDLVAVCKFLRTVGLSKQEVASIPADQMLFIENAPQFLQAAECVGKALYELYQQKKVCGNDSKMCEDSTLRRHIKEEPFSFRIVEDIYNRARAYIPKETAHTNSNPFLNYQFARPSGSNTLEMRMENQGEGLEKAIEAVAREIFTCPEAKPELCEPVLGAANQILSRNGIGSEEMYEARSYTQARLKDMFKFRLPGQKQAHRANPEALRIQEVICDMIKERYPSESVKKPDEIMDAMAIESFLADIRENPADEHNMLGKAILLNTSEDANAQTPFIETAVVETFGVFDQVDTKDLAEANSFLTAMTIDGLAENNLKTIWPKMFGVYQEMCETPEDSQADEVLSGKNPNVAYNSFIMKTKEEQPIAIDIVSIPSSGETLIVGEGIAPVTAVRLKQRGITYVDRTEEGATRKIGDWLDERDVDGYVGSAVDAKFNTLSSGVSVEKLLSISLEQRTTKNMAQVTTYSITELTEQTKPQEKSIDNMFQIWNNIKKQRG